LIGVRFARNGGRKTARSEVDSATSGRALEAKDLKKDRRAVFMAFMVRHLPTFDPDSADDHRAIKSPGKPEKTQARM
jgi:hypothetical protein